MELIFLQGAGKDPIQIMESLFKSMFDQMPVALKSALASMGKEVASAVDERNSTAIGDNKDRYLAPDKMQQNALSGMLVLRLIGGKFFEKTNNLTTAGSKEFNKLFTQIGNGVLKEQHGPAYAIQKNFLDNLRSTFGTERRVNVSEAGA